MQLQTVFGALILTVVKANRLIYDAESFVTNEVGLIKCINAISEKYFQQRQNIEIIWQNPRDSVIKSFEESAIVVTSSLNFQRPDFRQMVTKYAMIFLERPNYAEDVKMLSSLKRFDPQGRYIISVDNEVHLSSLDEYITKIINYLASIERWNVVILMNDLENGGTRVLSYTLYSSGNCTRTPKMINHGDCGSAVTLNNLFPVFVNLHKCPVRLMTVNFPPYNMIDSKNGEKYTHGIESNVVKFIVEKLNATSQLSEEYNNSDMLEKLQNRTEDLAWGNMAPTTSLGTVFSQIYFQIKIVVIIPESRRMSSWTNLVLPFQREVWITLGVVIALPLVIKVVSPFVGRAFAVEYLLGGFTGVGVSRSPSKLSHRLYYMTWLIGGYVIMQAYLANLTGILTSPPQQKQMQSIDELERTRIALHGLTDMRKLWNESFPRISRDWKVWSMEEYNENILKMQAGQAAVAATYVSDIRIPNITHGRELNFHVIPEVFNTLPVALLMPNSSVLLEGSNRIIGRVSAAGFVDYWKKKYIRITLTGASSIEYNNYNSMLSLSHLIPVFLMICVGYIISIIIFILELCDDRP